MNSNNTVRIPATEAAEKYLEHRKTEVRDDTVRGESTPVRKFAAWIEDQDKELLQFAVHRRGVSVTPLLMICLGEYRRVTDMEVEFINAVGTLVVPGRRTVRPSQNTGYAVLPLGPLWIGVLDKVSRSLSYLARQLVRTSGKSERPK